MLDQIEAISQGFPEEFVQEITDIATGVIEEYEDFTGDVWQSPDYVEAIPDYVEAIPGYDPGNQPDFFKDKLARPKPPFETSPIEAIPGYQPDNQFEVPVPRIPQDEINIADFKPITVSKGPEDAINISDFKPILPDTGGFLDVGDELYKDPIFGAGETGMIGIDPFAPPEVKPGTSIVPRIPQDEINIADYFWDDFEELPEGWEWQLVDGNWEAVNTDYSDPSTWDLNNDGSIDLLDQLIAISQGLPQEIIDQITNYSLSPDSGTVVDAPEYLQEEIGLDADKPFAEELPEGWEWQFVNGNWEPVELDPEPEEGFGAGTVVGAPEYLQEEATLIPETDKPWTEELPEGWEWQQVDGNWEPVKIDDLDIVDIGEDPGTGTVIDAPEYLQEEVPTDIDKTYIHWLSNFNPNNPNTWDYNNDGVVDNLDQVALIEAGAPVDIINTIRDYLTTGEIPEGLDELPEGWEWQQIDGNWEAVNVDYSDISSWDLNNDGSIDNLDQILAISQGLPEEIIQQMSDYIAPPDEGTVVDVPEYLQEPDKPSPIYEAIPMMPSDELPEGYEWSWNERVGEWEPVEITPQEQEIIEEGPGGIGQEVIGGIESETGQTVDVPEYLQEPEDMYGKLSPEEELPEGWEWQLVGGNWEPVELDPVEGEVPGTGTTLEGLEYLQEEIGPDVGEKPWEIGAGYVWGPGYGDEFTGEYEDWVWSDFDVNNDGYVDLLDVTTAINEGLLSEEEIQQIEDIATGQNEDYDDFEGQIFEEEWGYVDPDESIDYPWDPSLEWQYNEETGEWNLAEVEVQDWEILPELEPEYWNPAPHTAAPFTLGDWSDIPYEYQEYMQQIFPELLGGTPLGMPTSQTDFTGGVVIPYGDAYDDWYNAMEAYFNEGYASSTDLASYVTFEQWMQGMGSHMLPADLQHLADPANIDPTYGSPPLFPEDAGLYNIPFDPYDIGGLTLAMAIEMGWNPETAATSPFLNPEAIYSGALSNLSQYAEWDPSMLRALSPDMIDKLSYGYYDPIMESARGQAMQQTMQQYGGGYGDVLNVGAYEDMLQSQIDAGLMSGYEDILGMQQAAGQEVTGVMDEWAQLLAQLQGGT